MHISYVYLITNNLLSDWASTMDTKTNINIIIAEDHQLFAEGLEKLLTSEFVNYNVIAKVNNGKKLMHMLNSHAPDLVLLDINMPFMDGLTASLEIRKKLPEVKIIIISMYTNPAIIAQAKKNGVNGFIPKDTSIDILKESIEKVLNNEDVFLTGTDVQEDLEGNEDIYTLRSKLSPRQLEIVRIMNQGTTSNKDIANELFISIFTVETHLKNIYQALKINSKIELIRLNLKA